MSEDRLSSAPIPAEPGHVGEPAPPTVADGRWRGLDPRSVTVERIGAWIAVAVVAAPLLAATLLVELLAPLPRWLAVALPMVVLGALAGLGWLAHGWPPVAFRHRGWRLDEQRLEIRRGVVWQRVISIPRSRVQHTDIAQGPLERTQGLGRLVVHTAGTQGASVALEGLEHGTAAAIRDHLVRNGDDDAR